MTHAPTQTPPEVQVIDPSVVGAAIERHRREPDLTPDQYIRRLMISLGEAISQRRKIYLDTRYWIFLRDAAMDRPRLPIHGALLRQLREAVSHCNVLCPISDVTLTELLKQSDDRTRLATARVVDELSCGVALCLEDQRVGTEFAHFLYDVGAHRPVHALSHLVWTKACFVWGEHYPRGTRFAADTERALQKAFVDHQWTLSLEQIVRTLGRDLVQADFAGMAQRLNDGNRAHASELRTFAELLVNELAGILDLYKERLGDIVAQMYERQHGEPPNLSLAQREDNEAQMRNVFINLFRLRTKVMAQRAPTLYVGAKCHAAVRWNRNKKLSANDLMDFHHAAAALGYCDAFFTDNPLKVMLTQNHVNLPSELGRFVTADETEALRFVEALPRSSSVVQNGSPGLSDVV